MKLKLISCEVFYREMCYAISRSPNQVDVEFLPKGLHDLGAPEMQKRIQAALAGVPEEKYDAVLFGYGLCNNGLHGLRAGTTRVVVPRAHDCITLFFGSKEKYQEYFWSHPGTYFKTSGWIERGEAEGELKQLSIGHLAGMDKSYEEMVEEYGEDNAQYLIEVLGDQGTSNYGQFTFIEMGVEPDDRFERQAKAEADERGWKFEKVRGDMSLIQRLVDGPWADDDFLLIPPGGRLVAKYDEGVIALDPDAAAPHP